MVLQVYFQLLFKWLGGRNRFELVAVKSAASKVTSTHDFITRYDSITTNALQVTWCVPVSYQTIFFTQSHSSLLPTCFTLSLEPASYITQNSSSELLIPLSATFTWTCRAV